MKIELSRHVFVTLRSRTLTALFFWWVSWSSTFSVVNLFLNYHMSWISSIRTDQNPSAICRWSCRSLAMRNNVATTVFGSILCAVSPRNRTFQKLLMCGHSGHVHVWKTLDHRNAACRVVKTHLKIIVESLP